MRNEAELSAEYRRYKPEIDAAVMKVLDSGRYILGPEVKRFEERFAEYVGSRYCVGVGNGYDALYLIFMAIGAKGKYLYIKNELHRSTTNAARLAGATIMPIEEFAEIVCITQSYNKHSAGDMFREGKIYVEDACQGLGVRIGGRHVGTFGLAGAFSFHPFKPLHCYGDGGAIVTDDSKLYNKLIRLRNHGREGKQYHLGVNSRLDEIQAAILNVYLNHIDELLKGDI